MKKDVTLELCDAIGKCSGALANALNQGDSLPKSQLDNIILENYGFILAWLYVADALDYDETGECIACFCAVYAKCDRNKYVFIAKALMFYVEIVRLREERHGNEFVYDSILAYNLYRPGTWNKFEDSLPIDGVDALSVSTFEMVYMKFFTMVIPEELNPILSRL